MQVIRDVTPLVLGRPLKLCNFLDWKDNKVCYRNAFAVVDTWSRPFLTRLAIIAGCVQAICQPVLCDGH